LNYVDEKLPKTGIPSPEIPASNPGIDTTTSGKLDINSTDLWTNGISNTESHLKEKDGQSHKLV
jgi:hypothetical protein